MIPYYLPLSSFLAALLVVTALPASWRERNGAALSLTLWLFCLNVAHGINSSIWMRDARVHAAVWCDITTKLEIGVYPAILTASVCLCSQFEAIASGRIMRWTSGDYRKQRLLDLAACIAVPFIVMMLHLIVQPRRFDIVEGFGCRPAVLPSVPAILVLYFPNLLLAAGALLFSTVAVYHAITQRLTFTSHLIRASPSDNGLYPRLTAMATFQSLWAVAVAGYEIHHQIQVHLVPWSSWAISHANFAHVQSRNMSELTSGELKALSLVWWTIPIAAYAVFMVSALSASAMNRYSRTYEWIRCAVFRRPAKPQSSADTFVVRKGVPSHIIVHKLSTVDVRSDVDDLRTLPPYTPSKGRAVKKPNLKISPSRRSFDSISSLGSIRSLPRIFISEEFPASRPPTPPHRHHVPLEDLRDSCTQ
ncbi:pheromone A receptor-domain-containing protein [Cristinia sonorae]|uniref:Pheromone A receptor-domain-containing protein n=1 Tax=Cristinia sonorae TaxID=1940300 RepID=A0A8K0XQM9_9AGAR|nr:pheromone A receptor-domain-containing protein [Cristinia sonorae]